MKTKFFLPGTDKQLNSLLNHLDLNGKTVLVIGPGSEGISESILNSGAEEVVMIVEDNDSLLNSRLLLPKEEKLSVRLMEFDNTDFPGSKFDLVYAQASISNNRRNKIIKEIKRILKPEGYFCVGENISYTRNAPAFVKNIWNSSEIVPLFVEDLENYYLERKFEIIFRQDLSHTLKDFYSMSAGLLKDKAGDLTEREKSYHKKFLKKISHESNAYLKLGGDNYMGYKMLILRKAVH